MKFPDYMMPQGGRMSSERATNRAARFVRRELRKRYGHHYPRFTIRTAANNRAVSVHWSHWDGGPSEVDIQAIGKPLVTGTAGDGLWFFQTHRTP
jgi:hypothetical protein